MTNKEKPSTQWMRRSSGMDTLILLKAWRLFLNTIILFFKYILEQVIVADSNASDFFTNWMKQFFYYWSLFLWISECSWRLEAATDINIHVALRKLFFKLINLLNIWKVVICGMVVIMLLWSSTSTQTNLNIFFKNFLPKNPPHYSMYRDG